MTPVSGDVLLPPSKLGGFGNTLLATNVRDCQSFGQVVVCFANERATSSAVFRFLMSPSVAQATGKLSFQLG